jgi:hypothetical protein
MWVVRRKCQGASRPLCIYHDSGRTLKMTHCHLYERVEIQNPILHSQLIAEGDNGRDY